MSPSQRFHQVTIPSQLTSWNLLISEPSATQSRSSHASTATPQALESPPYLQSTFFLVIWAQNACLNYYNLPTRFSWDIKSGTCTWKAVSQNSYSQRCGADLISFLTPFFWKTLPSHRCHCVYHQTIASTMKQNTFIKTNPVSFFSLSVGHKWPL